MNKTNGNQTNKRIKQTHKRMGGWVGAEVVGLVYEYKIRNLEQIDTSLNDRILLRIPISGLQCLPGFEADVHQHIHRCI